MRFLTRLKRSLRKRSLARKFGEAWHEESDAFRKRRYASYDDYLAHQAAKLETHEFGEYDTEFRNALRERLAALDIDRIAREVRKVLTPGGLFVLEAVHGRDQGINPGFFESFFWKNINELVRVFENAGFAVGNRKPITRPWPGEQICLSKSDDSQPPIQ